MKTKTALAGSGLMLVLLLLVGATMFSGEDVFNNSIQGAFSMVDIAPAGFDYEPPLDVTLEDAEAAIVQAELDIEEMRKFNFITLFAEDSLKEAKQALGAKDYPTVLKLTALIGFIKKEKIDFFDRVRLLEVKKQTMEEKGMEADDFDHTNEMMHDAMNAFTLDQLDDANKMLDAADADLKAMGKESSRVKLLGLMSKNFFLRYWWQILIILVFLGATSPLIYSKVRKNMLRRKIRNYKIELSETKNVIKDLQKECFVKKSIPTKTYQDRAAKYEERMTEIKHTIPVLEAKLRSEKGGFFSFLKSGEKKSGTKKSSSKKSRPKKATGKELKVKLGGQK